MEKLTDWHFFSVHYFWRTGYYKQKPKTDKKQKKEKKTQILLYQLSWKSQIQVDNKPQMKLKETKKIQKKKIEFYRCVKYKWKLLSWNVQVKFRNHLTQQICSLFQFVLILSLSLSPLFSMNSNVYFRLRIRFWHFYNYHNLWNDDECLHICQTLNLFKYSLLDRSIHSIAQRNAIRMK